ncbi:MAG TPA: ubiquinone biosynthesis regulatory protein kinase UbiB [Thiotrichaceae bacterium]|jgi:ubiquinone biosynthesis protein|nr:ubiquinone biosynthesis regulatory protein kinase UbiB [Thiotrichaceae bacterium]HIM07418.1 ubiquinone biosynthesis regulatory protein kinase UbiB [Gammaproteobacteria bacterium]
MRQFLRLLTIQRTFIKYGLDEFIFATHLFRPFRFVFYLLPWNWFGSKVKGSRAVRLRLMLEELGPIYVKLGQILSTRRDLVPEDIVNEFSKLQDDVAPFPGSIARKIIEDAYECELDEVFLEFNETPLASASVAQVHRATLKDGSDYIIKVLRPDIEILIRQDLSLLQFLAEKAEKYYPKGKALRFTGVVEEFEKTLMNELDFQREAANASQLRRNFKDEDRYYVPEINWKLTRRNVLAMERVSGISVRDLDALKDGGIDLKWLAEYGVEVFFTQVFRDNFFHADMHPGNIFVGAGVGDNPVTVKVIDFGIMCSLTEFDQHYLADNFIAFLNRDYHRVAALHIESGWVPKGTRLDELESSIRTVCEPLLDRPIHEISFGELLQRLFQIARSFNMEIMPQLIMLQKTIINIEGIGRYLYPELDLWETARPQLERWMGERIGVRGLLKGAKINVPKLLERMPDLPNKALDVLDMLRDGKMEMENKSEEIHHLRQEMKAYNQRTVLALVGSGFLMSASIIYALDHTTHGVFFSVPIVSWLLGFSGMLMLYISWQEK